MFKKLLFAVLFFATTANVSGSVAGVKRSHEVRNVVEKRQSIPISQLPAQCQKICAPAIDALNSISKCKSATCLCNKTVDSSFQGCINCIVKVEPQGNIAQDLKQLTAEYNELCSGTGVSSLTVGSGSTTSSTTKTKSSSTHTSTSTTSSTSTSATGTTSSTATSSTGTSSATSSSSSSSDTGTTASSSTESSSLSSLTSATGSLTSNSLTPTSTFSATASATTTSSLSNAAHARANIAGVEYPLIALITTLFALAF